MKLLSYLPLPALAIGMWCVAAQTVFAVEPVPSFELDVQPILTARGCNQGACHGKARGQNGFQLSLLGFDSDFDHAAISANARGRRVFPASPDRSLLLQKAAGLVPHGGGQRIVPDSDDYIVLKRWIEGGALRRVDQETTLASIEVEPKLQYIQPGEQVQLKVVAHYTDGTTRDVSARTQYQSSEAAMVGVNNAGLATAGPLPGEATIMARYMNVIVTSHLAIPLAGEVPDEEYAKLPRHNFIDELVWTKLKSLGITPSEPCDDAKYLRRVHLDLIGRLPTPDEVRAFVNDAASDKRARLVDRLLERPEYADHWTAKWADLLRPNPYRVGIKAVVNYDDFIRDSFRQNKPYDQFVRELVSAQGSTWKNGATVLFRDRREPEEITTIVSQLFLGIRLECAKCHHHPFEKWSQDDFYSFAAYFGKLGHKGVGLSPPISGGEEMVFAREKGEVKHPITEQVLSPRALFAPQPEIKEGSDPRAALADWITRGDNEYFAKVMVNRVWADLMGRGIVEPVDDLRATNPPTNGPLLDALAKDFQAGRFDIKHLLRTITTSHVYALSSLPGERNIADRQNYSRHYRTRLKAEVLLDAVTDITGVPEQFGGLPAGSKANQIWTTRVNSVFLDTFGRPNENQDPPCERLSDATVTQTLHLMNAPALHSRMTSDEGHIAKLAASKLTPDEITSEIYLLVYSRFPDAQELDVGRRVFAEPGTNRRQAAEDICWALLNTPEFAFKD